MTNLSSEARVDCLRGGPLHELTRLLDRSKIDSGAGALECYSYDGFLERQTPALVVHPASAEEVSTVVKFCSEHGIPFVARGSGTGYAGGSVPPPGGIVLALGGLRHASLSPGKRTARAQCGALTSEVMVLASEAGLRYPPDPSSYNISTIGGNIATNAGGPHCLGYGVTSNYISELEVVLPDGQIRTFGGKSSLAPNLDVRGVLVGAEGTLGIVTAATIRLIAAPETIVSLLCTFAGPDGAVAALEELSRTGQLPHAFDMCTGTILPSRGLQYDGSTITYIDVEGCAEDVEEQVQILRRIVSFYGGEVEILPKNELNKRRLQTTVDRWRKVVRETSALRYFLFDAVVPRSSLNHILKRSAELALEHRLPLSSTFHAGDGNIHPCVFYDPTDDRSRAARAAFFRDVFREVKNVHGMPSGEHGIGVEKRHVMTDFFSSPSLELFRKTKEAFDPLGIANPNKVFESRGPGVVQRRSWELAPHGAAEVDLLNGYVKVDANATRQQIDQVLQETPYELGLDPIGWAGKMTVREAVSLGRPGLRDVLFGPCRDRFLGGVFELDGKQLTIGSPFAKDVSGYELRKLAYGGKDLFGALRFAWLTLRRRRTEHWFEAKRRGQPVAETYFQIARLGLPLSVLAVTWTSRGGYVVKGAVCGSERLIARVEDQLKTALGRELVRQLQDHDEWLAKMTSRASYYLFAESSRPEVRVGQSGFSSDWAVALPQLDFNAVAIRGREDRYAFERRNEQVLERRLQVEFGH